MNESVKIIDIPDLPNITLPERIDVTDPCYRRDVWCRINDILIKPGEYRCYAKRTLENRARLNDNNDIYFDGLHADSCITEITIVHTDIKQDNLGDFELVDSIGVDAGLAGFFPAPYEAPKEHKDWLAFCDRIRDIDKTRRIYGKNKYKSIKDIPIEDTISDYIYDIKNEIYVSEPIENAFFSSSGYGDGSYQLEGVKKDGVYVALRLVFIDDN